jgi:hypothetical protein
MMRNHSSYRIDLRLSTLSDGILDRWADAFGGRWCMAEAAILHSVRNGREFPNKFNPDGNRLKMNTSVDLRSVTQRDPYQLGATLHRELDDFRNRVRIVPMPEPSVEVTAYIPDSALRELRIAAFASGRTLLDELSLREAHAAVETLRMVKDTSGRIREIPFRMPKYAFDAVHQAARTLGSRPIPAATQRMVEDLYAGVTV